MIEIEDQEFMNSLFTKVAAIRPLFSPEPDHLDYASINEIFASVDVAKASPLRLVAALRGTFSVREHMSNWHLKRDQVEKELSSRGLNAALMLRGLYKEQE